MIEAVWDIMFYWAAVSRELNKQPIMVRAVFILACAHELRKANLL
jgi:hypothetical protein